MKQVYEIELRVRIVLDVQPVQGAAMARAIPAAPAKEQLAEPSPPPSSKKAGRPAKGEKGESTRCTSCGKKVTSWKSYKDEQLYHRKCLNQLEKDLEELNSGATGGPSDRANARTPIPVQVDAQDEDAPPAMPQDELLDQNQPIYGNPSCPNCGEDVRQDQVGISVAGDIYHEACLRGKKR